MCYSVEYAPRAIKDLKKLDKHTRQCIKDWIEKILLGVKTHVNMAKD